LNRKRQAGFTLIEVIVALAIGGAVIATAVALQQTVLRTGRQLESSDRTWTAEQFLRSQVGAMAAGSDGSGFFRLRDDELILVTARSARFGYGTPAVAVRYRFEAGGQRLSYTEAPLPPAWDDPDRLDRFQSRFVTGSAVDQTWSATVFDNLDGGRFEVWDKQEARWRRPNGTLAEPPAAIRLSVRDLSGARRIMLDSGESSSFSFSGS
jgi:prepilin-type N-terminal cleavage/methylation domain-containing protein